MKKKIEKSTVARHETKNNPAQGAGTIKLKSILVPVDFSPPSQKALHYALSFAEQFGARIILLYVLEPAVYPTELGYVPAEIAPEVEFPLQALVLWEWREADRRVGLRMLVAPQTVWIARPRR